MTDENDDVEQSENSTAPYADKPPAKSHPESSLSLDTVFELLADRKQRTLLMCLRETPEPTVTMLELADQFSDSSTPQDDDSSHNPAVIRLHHQYLPELENAGVLEYDQRSGMVRYRGDCGLHAWLDYVRRRKSGWD